MRNDLQRMTRRELIRAASVVSAAGALPFARQNHAQARDATILKPATVLIDLVHNNPGETPFVSHYNDPSVLKNLGYTGKVYELFQAAQFGIDWSSVDPDIFPVGSKERAWVDAKAAELDGFYRATKAKGLDVFCHTDMIIFPKRLVEKQQLKDFGNISNPDTQRYLRAAIAQMFQRFPQLDGLVVRIGETYLMGAPYHTGHIANKADPQKTIIPLLNLLRDEVCEKLPGKKVIFRSWDSFDTSAPAYLAVSDGVEPHPNLFISVKHCEDDFHRGNRFSRVLGIGRHRQTVEVQCQREYEGKAAYPNYIAHGVIEGFEEHGKSENIRTLWANPLIAGMFTWSRGGGWGGPYITNELWCDLNIFVLSRWARSPNRTEESIFGDYTRDVLKLSSLDAAKFRRLALLSADAVYRGIRSTRNDINPMWTRDHEIGIPPLPTDSVARQRVLDEKDEAVRIWTEIVALAESIHFPDAATADYAVTSSLYGLYVYTIYRTGFQLVALGAAGDKVALRKWIDDYDATWTKYRALKADHPACATLYDDTPPYGKRGIGALVDEMRKVVAG